MYQILLPAFKIEPEEKYPKPLVPLGFLSDMNLLRAGAQLPVAEVFNMWPNIFEFEG